MEVTQLFPQAVCSSGTEPKKSHREKDSKRKGPKALCKHVLWINDSVKKLWCCTRKSSADVILPSLSYNELWHGKPGLQLRRICKCLDLSSPNMVAAPSGIGVEVLLKSCCLSALTNTMSQKNHPTMLKEENRGCSTLSPLKLQLPRKSLSNYAYARMTFWLWACVTSISGGLLPERLPGTLIASCKLMSINTPANKHNAGLHSGHSMSMEVES